MNKLTCILILMCLFEIPINAQIENNQFLQKLNSIKKEHSGKDFKIDTALNYAAKYFKFNGHKINKDYLRSFLRQRGNFDYNIEVIELICSKSKSINDIINESGDQKLKLILYDSLYNHIGFFIDEGIQENKVKLVASQNFIEFDKDFAVECHTIVNDYYEIDIISGTSGINDIYFNVYAEENNKKTKTSNLEKIKLNHDNRFEIRIKRSKNITDIPKCIEIVDSQGKVLSVVKINE